MFAGKGWKTGHSCQQVHGALQSLWNRLRIHQHPWFSLSQKTSWFGQDHLLHFPRLHHGLPLAVLLVHTDPHRLDQVNISALFVIYTINLQLRT